MILLDSSTLIRYLRGMHLVVQRLQQCWRHELRIPSVVAYEITYVVLKKCSRAPCAVTSALLEGIVQIPFDTGAAAEAAQIRVELESRGLAIGPMDLLIAATAVSRGAVLATCNTDEFRRVKGLKIIDWTKPNAPHA